MHLYGLLGINHITEHLGAWGAISGHVKSPLNPHLFMQLRWAPHGFSPHVLVCGRSEGIKKKGKGAGIQRFGPWSHLRVTLGSLIPGEECISTLERTIVGCVGWICAVQCLVYPAIAH